MDAIRLMTGTGPSMIWRYLETALAGTPALSDETTRLRTKWRYRPSKWDGPDDEMPTGLRTIDPACGSGHFLLGIFHRL